MNAAPDTVGDLVRRTTAQLEADGLLTARLDAELIVAHVLGLTRAELTVGRSRTVSPADAENYWQPIVDIAVPFASQHLSGALSRGIDSGEPTRTGIRQFVSMVKSTARPNKPILDVFADRIVVAS